MRLDSNLTTVLYKLFTYLLTYLLTTFCRVVNNQQDVNKMSDTRREQDV